MGRYVLLAAVLGFAATGVRAECPSTGLAIAPITGAAAAPVASYLVFMDGRAPVAVNIGPGSARTVGGRPALSALFLSALRTEQTADLPALVAHWQTMRHDPLTVYGPPGSRTMPSTTAFVRALFEGTRGAYRYLGDVVSPLAKGHFRLMAHDVSGTRPRLRPGVIDEDPAPILWQEGALAARAAATGSGTTPSLAWRLQGPAQSIVVLDAASQRSSALAAVLADADLVIARVQLRESDGPVFSARTLAALLRGSKAAELVLAGDDDSVTEAALALLKQSFAGTVSALSARDCWVPTRTANAGSQ